MMVVGLMFVTVGCTNPMVETEAVTDEFFELIAGGYWEEAYEFTGDEFKEYTSYDVFAETIVLDGLDLYLDFVGTSYEEQIVGDTIEHTLYGMWFDVDDYYYDMEVYLSKVGEEGAWELVGFYFY